MKKSGTVLTVLILTIVLWAVNGFAYTIDDDTLVRQGLSSSNSTSGWVDVVGEPSIFDVYGIDISWSPDHITFDLYTNFDGYYTDGNVEVFLADLALNVDGIPGYEYGIVMSGQSASSLGVGLYQVTDWDTSSDFIEGEINPRYWYGERWNDAGILRDPIVTIAGGTKVGDLDPAAPSLISLGSNPSYQWSFTIVSSDLIGLGSSMDVFWGNATCANDVIAGTVAPVPEPATMLLFGVGLIGMIGLGRKKFLKR